MDLNNQYKFEILDKTKYMNFILMPYSTFYEVIKLILYNKTHFNIQ